MVFDMRANSHRVRANRCAPIRSDLAMTCRRRDRRILRPQKKFSLQAAREPRRPENSAQARRIAALIRDARCGGSPPSGDAGAAAQRDRKRAQPADDGLGETTSAFRCRACA
jgi:hypothetical protein